MTFRSSVLRYSLRMGSKQLSRSSRRGAGTIALLFKNGDSFSLPVLTKIRSPQLVQARFSSSDTTKCVEHKEDNCSRCAKEVNLDELTSLMEDAKNLKLVDVRESYELRDTGEIPNSINIPLTQLKGTLQLESELFQEKTGLSKPSKADSIVFYGMGSIRSVAALEIACKMGYTKARHYPGGWREWSKMHN